MDQGDAAGVLVDEGEGRAGDVAVGGDAQAARQALDEGRLAGAQRADQRQHVADLQQPTQALGQRLKVGGGARR